MNCEVQRSAFRVAFSASPRQLRRSATPYAKASASNWDLPFGIRYWSGFRSSRGYRRRSHLPTVAPVVQVIEEEPWPLTKEVVSRSLQSHSFRTDKLRRNSNDEVVWRWLKESIASYPQNWVRLNIADNESYGVVLYPEKHVDSTTILSYNRELGAKRLPLLREGKRYLPIAVYQGNIICPSWSGLIDIEEAKLVYFIGESA